MATEAKIEQRKQQAYKLRKKNVKKAQRKLRPSAVKKLVGIICIALVVLIGCGAWYFSSGVARRLTTAVTIGKEKINAAEYSYYYNNAFTSYYQTMVNYFGEQYVGVDLSKSLKDQDYNDGETYAEHFSEEAVGNLQSVAAMAGEAQKAGFELTAESQERFDTQMQSLEDAAKNAGQSIDKYVETVFGKGYTKDMYEKILKKELLAQDYRTSKQESFTYTDEDLEAYYEEHKDDYDKVSYRSVAFNAAEATETEAEVTVEDAKAKADAFMDGVTNEVKYVNKVKEHSKEVDGTETDNSLRSNVTRSSAESTDANLVAWLFDPARQIGDMDVIENADGTGYFAVYLVKTAGRDEYKTRSVRHILINVSEDVTSEDAKAKAEEIYEEWKNGDATEDSFAELAEKYSEDTGSSSNGGLYEKVTQGQMVTAFDGWLFSDHQVGDTGIVETEYGFHIMYYVGESEQPKWLEDVETAKRNEDFNAWYDEILKDYPTKTRWLGTKLRTEPLPVK